jgi:hypothetical protein
VIRVCDEAGNVIERHEHNGDFKRVVTLDPKVAPWLSFERRYKEELWLRSVRSPEGTLRECSRVKDLETIYQGLQGSVTDAAKAGDWKAYWDYLVAMREALSDARKFGCVWAGTAPLRAADSVANALHTRFLSAALAVKVRRAKEMAAQDDRPVGQTSARDAYVVPLVLRHLSCMGLEATIENAIQYLRDHWNTLTTEERDDLEKAIRKALEEYQTSCG